jgi:tyrosyl-tRNA synthetase
VAFALYAWRMPSDFLSELSWRGLLSQATDEAGLRAHLTSGQRKVYVGFDPTADSLTIGNLVPIMLLAHVQRAGHVPVVVSGGGTGLIGDPSGKSSERTLMTRETVMHNCQSQMRIFGRILDFSDSCGNRAILTNNVDWLSRLSYLDALRDVGKHFSVNMMVQKDSVRERLNSREQGISYTEFSYMILQAYDFLHLYRELGVTVQLGGSDQYGNIVAGTDLIRRTMASEFSHAGKDGAQLESAMATVQSFGATAPLVTKSDGGKFGKTESGAIWLTADRTSPYAYYQFWLNASDDDAKKWIRIFTFLSREEIESLETQHAANPGERALQRALARNATTILHGQAETDAAEATGKALFSGDVSGLSLSALQSIMTSVPSSTQALSQLAGEGLPYIDLLLTLQLAASKREAREFLQNGSVLANGRKVGIDDKVKSSDLLHGSILAMKRGKKNWHIAKWE